MCDENKNCSLGDDELICSLKEKQCPPGCNCLLVSVFCRSVSISLNEAFAGIHVIALLNVSVESYVLKIYLMLYFILLLT